MFIVNETFVFFHRLVLLTSVLFSYIMLAVARSAHIRALFKNSLYSYFYCVIRLVLKRRIIKWYASIVYCTRCMAALYLYCFNLRNFNEKNAGLVLDTAFFCIESGIGASRCCYLWRRVAKCVSLSISRRAEFINAILQNDRKHDKISEIVRVGWTLPYRAYWFSLT